MTGSSSSTVGTTFIENGQHCAPRVSRTRPTVCTADEANRDTLTSDREASHGPPSRVLIFVVVKVVSGDLTRRKGATARRTSVA